MEANALTVPQWLSWNQAAAYSTLSRVTLKRLAHAGRLPVSRVGRRTVICRNDLDALLAKHRTTGPVE